MNLKKQKLINLFMPGMLFCFILWGCSQETENEFEETEKEIEKITEDIGERQTEESTENETGLSVEELDLYEQMALYIQEGFRRYGIEGIYQAYFGPVEEEEEQFSCDILLEGEDELWREVIAYTVDAETAWYVFEGEDERIFSKDPYRAESEDSSFVTELRKNYRHKVQITNKTDLPSTVHYVSESGPIERDRQKEIPIETDSYVRPMLYNYQDERLNIDIIIEYPRVWLSDDELGKVVNEKLKNAFFKDYLEDGLFPGSKVNTSINRNYLITREDERYVSMRIYTNSFTQGNNHPGEWETGITIDLQTGEVLHLEDVIGKERSFKSLLESGVFEGLLSWEGRPVETWIAELHLEEEEPLIDYDSYFYLTGDGIGFITYSGGYYNCLEAKFEDLGMEKF